ncbi:MAG: TonB-dependent receptor plug domain-containing protein [Deltaproteobacteria bacterium]|nr:TonB-dependent receptor plug domain-containing protein [Deltaproteobacteria bacterium]
MPNIFSRTTFSALLAVTLASQPVLAAEEQAAGNDDLLAMYFDPNETEQTTTRAPKPLSQVAENVTIVTAAEIERMNAHNVDEVLNRVNGLYVQFNGRDFNGANSFFIHDSDYEHVLVLVDGIRWNFDNDGMAVTNSIPVEIIERIEVIKGPASSTWGSSLGGVINIITKPTGTTSRPLGALYGSYGVASSQHYSGTMSGKAGMTGYFFSVASQNSDGIILNREYDDESVYGKIDFSLPHNTTLTLVGGQANPDTNMGDIFGNYSMYHRDFWASAALDSALTNNIDLHVAGFRKKQDFMYPPYPDYYDAETTGVASRLTARADRHTIVMGAELDRVTTENSDPAKDGGREETWGLYINDTLAAGRFAVTPGIRYDHLSLTDNMLSPSLGMTWQSWEHTLFRALVTQGFRKPYLNVASATLDPEQVTSYQAGVETSVVPFLRIKATLFEHNIEDAWEYSYGTAYNGGKIRRYGYELEAATDPFYYFSLDAGVAYTYIDYHDRKDNDDTYAVKLTLLYDNPQLFTAELFSSYQWLNDDRTFLDYKDGGMIWDFNIMKKFQLCPDTRMDVFMTAHNLFNGADYWTQYFPNAHRWVEAGVRVHF